MYDFQKGIHNIEENVFQLSLSREDIRREVYDTASSIRTVKSDVQTQTSSPFFEHKLSQCMISSEITNRTIGTRNEMYVPEQNFRFCFWIIQLDILFLKICNFNIKFFFWSNWSLACSSPKDMLQGFCLLFLKCTSSNFVVSVAADLSWGMSLS